jgi:phage terminase small subunit
MTPQQFDLFCLDYAAKQLAAEEAKTKADTAKALVMNAVQEFGRVPTNAEASRRFEGAEWCGTVTAATTIEILDDNVTELELLLSQAKLSKVFPLMFSRRVEYTMLKDAERVLPQTRLPKKFAERIQQLYSRCFVPRKKTPSLKVETITTVREREEKAAKKAAKGGAK